jgi:hypothetical protein
LQPAELLRISKGGVSKRGRFCVGKRADLVP